ncbi:MAG: DUF3179 domain-containing protein [Actinobacteria bacterium]|nr:DUF3179 domain-containing protein [Actinomycetota bacterium]
MDGKGGLGIVVAIVTVGLALLLVAMPVLRQPGVEEADTPDLAVNDPDEVADPTETEPLPPGYQRVVSRDCIRPIYAPQFLTATETEWDEGTLVLGVALHGEAHAYPINVLNHREMVLDRLGGTPILSTW